MKIDNILNKIIKKINTGMVDAGAKHLRETIKLDFSADIKFDIIKDGAVLLVSDVPVAKEMVQRYSDGLHYKTAEAIDGIQGQFNPISVQHPNKLFNEMSEDEQRKLTIGHLSNGYTKDSKKYFDLYFFIERTPKEIIDSVTGGKSIDVSIGFNVIYDNTPGEFQGTHYDRKQTHIGLDHLAVLPGGKGRASFPDGVGIGADGKEIKSNEVNNLTDENKLSDALEKLGDANGKLKDAENKIKTFDDESAKKDAIITTFEKAVDEAKVHKDKADKYDAMIKELGDTETAKCTELKDKILAKRNDDAMKEHIDKMDSKMLQFTLDAMQPAKVNGLPKAKDNAGSKPVSAMDEARAYAKDKNQRVNKLGKYAPGAKGVE